MKNRILYGNANTVWFIHTLTSAETLACNHSLFILSSVEYSVKLFPCFVRVSTTDLYHKCSGQSALCSSSSIPLSFKLYTAAGRWIAIMGTNADEDRD